MSIIKNKQLIYYYLDIGYAINQQAMTKKQNSNRQVPLQQMISKQEKYMSSLLKEYSYDASDDFLQNQLNKARQQQIRERNKSVIQSKLQQRSQSPIKLPRLYSIKKRKQNKSRISDYQSFRAQIQSRITKAYGNDKQTKQFQQNKSRQNSRKKSPQKVRKNQKPQSFDNQLTQFSQPKTPIQNIKKYQESSESNDSSGEQIDSMPLKAYNKSLNQSLYSQIKQQMNYLLYNRNESLKDWTENLLMMFERHDKQLLILRFKASYLKKFESAFFQGKNDLQE